MKLAFAAVALVLLAGACHKKPKEATPNDVAAAQAQAQAQANVPPGSCDDHCLHDVKCKNQIVNDGLAPPAALKDPQLCRGICMGYEKDAAAGKIAAGQHPCIQ